MRRTAYTLSALSIQAFMHKKKRKNPTTKKKKKKKRYLCVVSFYFFCASFLHICASLVRVRTSPLRACASLLHVCGFLLRVYGSPLPASAAVLVCGRGNGRTNLARDGADSLDQQRRRSDKDEEVRCASCFKGKYGEPCCCLGPTGAQRWHRFQHFHL